MDTDDPVIIPQESPAAISIRAGVSTKRLVFILAGVLLGMLLAALDQTIVGTAMPRVIADLRGLSHYAWVFTAYMLASTVTVPIYGKLSDIYGRRIFYIGGMVIFLIGSALSGTSQNMTQLILFRAIQGLGAGAMMPIAIAIIGDIFPPAERGKWQGLTASVFGVASIVGPALGGWITDNLSWRWVFYVNMPIGVLAILTAGIALPKMAQQQQRQVDYLGAFLLMAGTVPMLLAFSWAGTTYPWMSIQVIGLLVFSAVVLTVAAIVESRVPEPIISPSLFKNNSFAVSVIATFLASAGLFGAIMYLPLFIQGVGGQSATASGAILTPLMLGFVGSSIVGGYLISRTGRYKLIAIVSFAVATVGLFLLSRMTPSTANLVIIRNMVITGLGIGATMGLFTIVVQNAFPFSKLGEVTAGLQFFRSIGGTIGVAILGTVMTNQFNRAFAINLPQPVRQVVPPGQLDQLRNPQVLLSPGVTMQVHQSFMALGTQGAALFDQLVFAIRESLATAITDLFMVSAVAMILALLATVFLKELPLRKTHHDAVIIATSEAIPGEFIDQSQRQYPLGQPGQPAD